MIRPLKSGLYHAAALGRRRCRGDCRVAFAMDAKGAAGTDAAALQARREIS
jgi:hypothetical protein